MPIGEPSLSQLKKNGITPEQEALIPVYRDRWKEIVLSTEPVDPPKASQAILSAYATFGKPAPKILFCPSPHAVVKTLIYQGKLLTKPGKPKSQMTVFGSLANQFYSSLFQQCSQTRIQRGQAFRSAEISWVWTFSHLLWRQVSIESSLDFAQIPMDLANLQKATNIISMRWLRDFYTEVLGWSLDFQKEWEIFKSICKTCGGMFPFEEICVVCDRPRILSFDNQRRLHGEGSPAIQFADGFSVYAYHGVNLPKKYGKVHPKKWQAEWILSEENAELKRVLIREIGYARISQELLATEVDTWQEYELLRINSDVDVEPIYLIKMTCPSTGYIHALRVPPDISSAREAIEWINWGIDPESFALQT